MNQVSIYTDGACKGNPGPGGWAALLKFNNEIKEITGYELLTTNNRMELLAAINALKELKTSSQINIYTDSEYLRLGITNWIGNWHKNGWKTASNKPVKNQDLWKMLHDLCKTHVINWHWVKGHAGHLENERVDFLANQAILCSNSNTVK